MDEEWLVLHQNYDNAFLIKHRLSYDSYPRKSRINEVRKEVQQIVNTLLHLIIDS